MDVEAQREKEKQDAKKREAAIYPLGFSQRAQLTAAGHQLNQEMFNDLETLQFPTNAGRPPITKRKSPKK